MKQQWKPGLLKGTPLQRLRDAFTIPSPQPGFRPARPACFRPGWPARSNCRAHRLTDCRRNLIIGLDVAKAKTQAANPALPVLVQREFVIAPIVELGGARGEMIRHRLGEFQRALVF